MGTIQSLKGTHDILPEQSWRWQALELTLRDFLCRYNYQEIRTPAFEKTELFARGVGAETDIVSKEMYTWTDQGGTRLTLKPELTAPVVRAYLQHNLGRQAPLTKLYYIDALYRRERPQKGRQRQFHQYGVEALGSAYPEIDAEVIAVAYGTLREFGLEKLILKLNSIGSEDCRRAYRRAIRDYLEPYRRELSETSRQRLDTNPLRILDTKLPHEQELLHGAPGITEYLTREDHDHFRAVREFLEDLEIPGTVDTRLVRGLDYYTRTTFEITTPDLGAQDALVGGGRYDGLVETLGGKPTPAVGFAAGIERILLALEATSRAARPDGVQVFFAPLGDNAPRYVLPAVEELRAQGLRVEMDHLRRSLKAQLREANRLGARWVVLVGPEELEHHRAQVKDLKTGLQKEVSRDELTRVLTALIRA